MNQEVKFKYTFPIAKSEAREDGNFLIGYASGPEVDSEKERMSPEAIQAFSDQINASSDGHRLVYRDAHAPDGVLRDLGDITKAWINEKMHLGIEVKLDMENPAAAFLWKQVNNGKQYGMSVAGRVYDYIDEFVAEVGSQVRTYKAIILDEISNTTRPAWYPSFGSVLAKSIKDAESAVASSGEVSEKSATTDEGENTLTNEVLLDAPVKDETKSAAITDINDERVVKWSSAASDASGAAYVLSSVLAILGDETSEADTGDADKLKAAVAAILSFIESETAEIGTVGDVSMSDTTTEENEIEKSDDEAAASEATDEASAESATEETVSEEVVTDDDAEKSDKDDEADVEKAGKKISAANAAKLMAMFAEIQTTLQDVGVIEADTTTDKSSDNAASTDAEVTIEKTDESETVDELTTQKSADELAAELAKARARIEELENSPTTVLPGLVTDATKKTAESDFEELLKKASPSERLRYSLAAHTGGR